jgi:hypothetical protein
LSSIEIAFKVADDPNGVPQISIDVSGGPVHQIHGPDLSDGDKLAIQHWLSKVIFPLWSDDHFFDQPSAARTLLGLVAQFNRVARESANAVFVEFGETFKAAINCEEQVWADLEPHQAQLSLGQNLIDLMMLGYIQIPLRELYREKDKCLITNNQFGDQCMFWYSRNDAAVEALKKIGITDLDLDVKMTTDREVLSLIPESVVLTETGYFLGPNGHTILKNNVFVQMKQTASDDITLLPINIAMEFDLTTQKSGKVEETSINGHSATVSVEPCQFIKDPNAAPLEKSEDDDDDEEEEDEGSSSLRVSNLAKIICSQTRLINEKIRENQDTLDSKA